MEKERKKKEKKEKKKEKKEKKKKKDSDRKNWLNHKIVEDKKWRTFRWSLSSDLNRNLET